MDLIGSIPLQTWGWAILGGVVPTLFWLWFWLRYDRLNPEPKGLLFLAFIAGALSTMVALPLQNVLAKVFIATVPFIVALALAEEVVKFFFARVIALRTKFYNEPQDAVVYLVTVALGFSAVENALYLISPLLDRDIALTIATGNLRFIGATVLHTVGAGIIGIALGLAFHKSNASKLLHFVIGLAAATAIHSLFNYFIADNTTESLLITFGILWITLVVTVLLFTKLNTLRPERVV